MLKKSFRVFAFVLLFAIVLSAAPFAAPAWARNSDYIDSYCAYMYSPSSGKAQVWFELKANTTSDKVGALTIFLQVSDDAENWTNVKTFRHADYPNMMESNTICTVTHVDANVESGHYYRGCLTLYVEKDGGSDSCFYVTDAYWI